MPKSLEWGFSLQGYFYLLGLFFVILFRFHYMVVLLSIEFMMLSLYFFLGVSVTYGIGGMDLLIFFLVMVVLEGAFGVTLLICYSLFSGGDYFGIFFGF